METWRTMKGKERSEEMKEETKKKGKQKLRMRRALENMSHSEQRTVAS